MDFAGITFESVQILSREGSMWEDLDHTLHEDLNSDIGSAIEMSLGRNCSVGDLDIIKISYYTNEDSKALNFIQASNTADKGKPMMYTFCSPIYCRSLAPMMDSPSSKLTYNAIITVDSSL